MPITMPLQARVFIWQTNSSVPDWKTCSSVVGLSPSAIRYRSQIKRNIWETQTSEKLAVWCQVSSAKRKQSLLVSVLIFHKYFQSTKKNWIDHIRMITFSVNDYIKRQESVSHNVWAYKKPGIGFYWNVLVFSLKSK